MGIVHTLELRDKELVVTVLRLNSTSRDGSSVVKACP